MQKDYYGEYPMEDQIYVDPPNDKSAMGCLIVFGMLVFGVGIIYLMTLYL